MEVRYPTSFLELYGKGRALRMLPSPVGSAKPATKGINRFRRGNRREQDARRGIGALPTSNTYAFFAQRLAGLVTVQQVDHDLAESEHLTQDCLVLRSLSGTFDRGQQHLAAPPA
jgi:hypothetical protein